MVTGVSFRGGETTGSVADRKIETAKQETTGGVGARKNQDSIFTVDNEPKQDTVCFRGAYEEPYFRTAKSPEHDTAGSGRSPGGHPADDYFTGRRTVQSFHHAGFQTGAGV